MAEQGDIAIIDQPSQPTRKKRRRRKAIAKKIRRMDAERLTSQIRGEMQLIRRSTTFRLKRIDKLLRLMEAKLRKYEVEEGKKRLVTL
jgi:hypothetical protein